MVEITPRKKVNGVVTATLKAQGDDFVSLPVEQLELTYEGIAGDYHSGITRKSGAREPWYERGIEMRNERQVSMLAQDELATIAKNMDLDKIDPGWIGANLMVEGVPDFSLLPARTVLIFEGGVTLRVDGYNGPCRIAGGSIAKHMGGHNRETDGVFDACATDLALAFKDAAHMKRGLVVWVEREGVIRPGEKFVGHVWPQWIYG
ncbi:MAG: MOSC domain-containing protein [Rhizobiaceae bacterium]|nr:MOSC domain-containing protein [Rhizobiaceae bacterium]